MFVGADAFSDVRLALFDNPLLHSVTPLHCSVTPALDSDTARLQSVTGTPVSDGSLRYSDEPKVDSDRPSLLADGGVRGSVGPRLTSDAQAHTPDNPKVVTDKDVRLSDAGLVRSALVPARAALRELPVDGASPHSDRLTRGAVVPFLRSDTARARSAPATLSSVSGHHRSVGSHHLSDRPRP